MNKKTLWFAVAVAVCSMGIPAWADQATVGSDALHSYDRNDAAFGKVWTLQLALPSISAETPERVIIELYIDVAAKDRDGFVNDTPLVEVYRVTGSTFSMEAIDRSSVVRRPVVVGSARSVILDVTPIVLPLVANGETSVVLAIGSLSGMQEGDFTVRSDVFDDGAVAQVHYTAAAVGNAP